MIANPSGRRWGWRAPDGFDGDTCTEKRGSLRRVHKQRVDICSNRSEACGVSSSYPHSNQHRGRGKRECRCETEQYAEPPHRRAAVDADASPQTTAMPPPPAPPPPARPPPAPPPPLGPLSSRSWQQARRREYERDQGGCVSHTWRRAELPARPIRPMLGRCRSRVQSRRKRHPNHPCNYSGPDPTC